ncbi:MAG: amidohydrolase family protein [Methylococcales bacterium]|jgi:uncharacterized protein|nr:amidohydrolase family protein [Methylococcales bacterium]MBT7444517.1 amidohydrolase family protein [Methylococcales bacterium]
MNRRQFLLGLGATAVAVGSGSQYLLDEGLKNPCLSEIPDAILQHPLYQKIWADLNPEQVWDCHAHMVGVGDTDSGIWVNPASFSWKYPVRHIQLQFYLNAACVADKTPIDTAFTERLLHLYDVFPSGAKMMLMAFEHHYDAQGQKDLDKTTLHVPNDTVAKFAKAHPERFEWIASVHPYRADAVDELSRCIDMGARAVKWLPPAMGMDPNSAKCDAFYQVMAKAGIPLITHAGDEKAVHGEDLQRFASPLQLRRPLSHGVKVVVAHAASLGHNLDSDVKSGQSISNFDLFARLMGEAGLEGTLFGEISAVTQRNRVDEGLEQLLVNTQWHSRLVNGSDYPLPGVMPLLSLTLLKRRGLLQADEVDFLSALRGANVLLFDLALKRLLKKNGQGFSAKVFESKWLFGHRA